MLIYVRLCSRTVNLSVFVDFLTGEEFYVVIYNKYFDFKFIH